MSTIAEEISARFNDDGSQWWDDEGIRLDAACREVGAIEERRGDAFRYRFPDGSAIITIDGAWDLALSEDERCWCWDSLGEHIEGCPLAQ